MKFEDLEVFDPINPGRIGVVASRHLFDHHASDDESPSSPEVKQESDVEDGESSASSLFGSPRPRSSRKRASRPRPEVLIPVPSFRTLESRSVSRNSSAGPSRSPRSRATSRRRARPEVLIPVPSYRTARPRVDSPSPPESEPEEQAEVGPTAKTYGHIEGIEVGTTWKTRKEVKDAHMHTHGRAGICWGEEGAYCVVLSEEYEEDVDNGETFIYTGSGDPEKDQSFERGGNRGLLTSMRTKNPVRVIRGPTRRSRWSPEEGYRYDGLYRVIDAELREGRNGKKVCRFYFKRDPGQRPLVEYKYRATLFKRMRPPKKKVRSYW
ncbi:hypothetical protein PLICRDRAFT_174688 [Plicaturopsis crispa FD-325 SS-3]|nr:hypothetical protein PLICRDRAFT_174688 [Plicaturopsis crispa FD-325 SS-3]